MSEQAIDLEHLPECPTPEQQVEMLRAVSTLSPDALIERMRDETFRYLLNDCFVYWLLRTQIRALRIQRGWSQEELASRTGFKQSFVSKIENIYHPTNVYVSTLQTFARAFDVRLVIQFMDWGSFIKDLEMLKGGVEDFYIPSFEDDPFFHTQEQSAGRGDSSDSELTR